MPHCRLKPCRGIALRRWKAAKKAFLKKKRHLSWMRESGMELSCIQRSLHADCDLVSLICILIDTLSSSLNPVPRVLVSPLLAFQVSHGEHEDIFDDGVFCQPPDRTGIQSHSTSPHRFWNSPPISPPILVRFWLLPCLIPTSLSLRASGRPHLPAYKLALCFFPHWMSRKLELLPYPCPSAHRISRRCRCIFTAFPL